MNRRILVVEDEDRLLRILVRHLTSRGFDCVTAGDGLGALQCLAGGGFDIALTDVRMPRLDGLAFLREAHRIAPDLKVVLMTGQASLEGAVRALRHGASDFLVKPFLLEELDGVLDRLAPETGRPAERPRSAPETRTTPNAPASVSSLQAWLSGEQPLVGSADTSGTGSDGARSMAAIADRVAAAAGLTTPERARTRRAARAATLTQEEITALEEAGEAARLARRRHERWDGRDARDDEADAPVPIETRCIAVAAAVLHATSPESTCPATDVRTALQRAAGTRLDPTVVEAFLRLPDEDLLEVLASADVRPGQTPVAPVQPVPVVAPAPIETTTAKHPRIPDDPA